MATTEEFKNGGSTSYSFSIEYLKASDIKVEIDGTPLTFTTNTNPSSGQYKVVSTTVTLGAAAAAGSGNVHIFRETDLDTAAAVFAAGSSIRAADLNACHDMVRLASQEQHQLQRTPDIKDQAVTSAKIKDATIVDADISGSAAIAQSKIATGLLPSGITVNSANIVDGSIVNDDINNSAAIAGTKISPDFGSQVVQTSGNIVVGGTVDGRDVAADGTKLDTIESNAKDDQTGSEIKTLYEANSNTNAFTDAEKTKLSGIETAATADQTAAEIKTLLQSDKLTTNEIVTGTLDNRYYTEAELNGGQLNSLYFTEAEITGGAADGRYYTETELNAGQLDNRYYTETELNAGQLDNRYYTETEAEALFLRQDSSETIASGVTWSSNDSKVATTAAIDARIIDLVDDVGGFVPLANETSFPTANPDVNNGPGTVVSVKAVSTNLTPSSGTVTIANGAGTGNTVTITGVTSVIPQGFGMILETTSTLHTYAFHRLQAKATEVSTVATNITNVINCGQNLADIENFADLYQISTSAPTTRADGTSLTVGDLWFDSSSNQVMMVYDGSSGDGFSPITPDQATITAINSVSGHITFQEDLGLITNAVNTGSGNNSINTVGANIANVNTTATNIAKIQTVADDLNETTSEIDTVATNIANVNSVGNNISNVNAVHNNATNINAAVANASNINSAVSNASNINAAVSNASNITTVAGNNANVTTVAGSISNVNTAATNIASINTTASNISNVNNFTDKYQIASSDPSTDGGGNALAAGDLYFNTSANELKVYTGSQWQGGVTATGNFATTTGNTFTADNVYNDNVKAKFGTSSDLEIYHNGNDSLIVDNGTGGLILGVSGTGTSGFYKGTGQEALATFEPDGPVSLYFNNTKRIETTNTGATITGLMTATTIDGAAGNNLQLDFGAL